MIAGFESHSSTNTARKFVYTVVEKGERSYWTRIGVAFVNRDNSLTIRLDALPVNGVLQVRDDEPAANKRSSGGAP